MYIDKHNIKDDVLREKMDQITKEYEKAKEIYCNQKMEIVTDYLKLLELDVDTPVIFTNNDGKKYRGELTLLQRNESIELIFCPYRKDGSLSKISRFFSDLNSLENERK